MIIQVDKEGKAVIEQLCDIALKQGGVNNLNQVNAILKSVCILPEAAPVVSKENGHLQFKSEVKKSDKAEETET